MAGRASLVRAEPAFSLPFYAGLASPPPPGLVAARIEAHASPGDIVLDLSGRGGWIAHAALDRQGGAVSLESGPLTRLLAELVLRPPDLRHFDAAFQAMGASPHGQTSLRMAVGEPFATRCPTCERMVVADEIVWSSASSGSAAADAPAPDGDHEAVPIRKQYRCHVCRGQRGGGDQRTAAVDADDIERARNAPERAAVIR